MILACTRSNLPLSIATKEDNSQGRFTAMHDLIIRGGTIYDGTGAMPGGLIRGPQRVAA
jgi:hypothetical protein